MQFLWRSLNQVSLPEAVAMECFKNMIKSCKLKCPTLPVVRKCCFCIPTRVGIAVFGYANLILSVIAFPWLVYLLVDEVTGGKPKQETYYVNPLIHLPIIMAIALVDISMTVVLLVGIHKNNTRLLKIYFYFGVMFELLTVITDVPFLDFAEYRENALYVFFLLTNIYLLFLVHNVVYITEDSGEVQYIAYQEHRPSV